jgi:hypothetical protein
MPLNCLFWNTGREQLDAAVVALAKATRAHIIALAEYPADLMDLARQLNAVGLSFFPLPIIGCERIRILTTFTPGHFQARREADRYTIQELTIPGEIQLILAIAHLPSKQHADDIDQLHTATFFKHDIELAEIEAKHMNTLVFGDFNMNPFDAGMMSAASLNSISCLNTARREVRSIAGRKHAFFYNPMWNLLGDFAGPPGTYFHASPGYVSQYWNLLDQVVLRPTLADRFDKTALAVLTQAGPIRLVNDTGRPTLSDHLPLFFSLNTENNVDEESVA